MPKSIHITLQNDQRKTEVTKFITKYYKPDQLTITRDVDVYQQYIKQAKQPMPKGAFTRALKSIGLFRSSRRFGTEVHKVYIYKNLKPCPNCTDCQTCHNTRYI